MRGRDPVLGTLLLLLQWQPLPLPRPLVLHLPLPLAQHLEGSGCGPGALLRDERRRLARIEQGLLEPEIEAEDGPALPRPALIAPLLDPSERTPALFPAPREKATAFYCPAPAPSPPPAPWPPGNEPLPAPAPDPSSSWRKGI